MARRSCLGALVGAVLMAGVLSTPAFGAGDDPVDDPVPLVPRITSDGTYTECTANDCVGRGEPGLAGTFTFRPNEADVDPETGTTDVTAYVVRLQGEHGSTVVSGAEASHAVVPPEAGIQTLEVRAKDWGERWSAPAYFRFNVKPAAGAVGHWQFADRPADPKHHQGHRHRGHSAPRRDAQGWRDLVGAGEAWQR
ncbi:hypothetical protein [Streptomyces sp. V1I1]|uniref:hypothetical protein n=1 Tax=Streptomyces sp. V1I1 TaxID=3042272 RepID=UPI00278695A2|nr:hypothetical protein [Streptomyces sp. V1I1]MDQ0943491.1 hypothetical protein [Streptomyces sp. V1I1]